MQNNSKLIYGIKDNKPVHINDVSSGLSCECLCPHCRSILVAKKGDIKNYHFAHYNGEDCNRGMETIIHITAKEVLMVEKKLNITNTQINFLNAGSGWKFPTDQIVFFDEIFLEKSIGGVRPDLLATYKDRSFAIEIFATHKTDALKINKYKEKNISAVEIDLSKIDLSGIHSSEDIYNKIKSVIFLPENHTWLYNAKKHNIIKFLILNSIIVPSDGWEFLTKWSDCPFLPVSKYITGVRCHNCMNCLAKTEIGVYCLGFSKINTLKEYFQYTKEGLKRNRSLDVKVIDLADELHYN